jgi:hypothetical protein
MNNSKNFQPSNPTYFLIAGDSQLELATTSRVTSLNKDGSIPPNQPRLITSSFGSTLRHMVACIGCDFVQKPKQSINDVYSMSSSPR